MCGRFTLTSADGIGARFSTAEPNAGEAVEAGAGRYNIAPTQDVLTVRNEGGRRRARMMRWGLVPPWADDTRIGGRMINARAETLAERPSFRAAFRRRRCLIVADGFYEWAREGRSRTPMRFCLASGELFAFAGLWETWRRPDGTRLLSCAIVTTSANELIAPFHERMPVIIDADAESVWLDPDVEDAGALSALLTPYPSDRMTAYEVSKVVNSAAYDGPECILPVSRLV